WELPKLRKGREDNQRTPTQRRTSPFPTVRGVAGPPSLRPHAPKRQNLYRSIAPEEVPAGRPKNRVHEGYWRKKLGGENPEVAWEQGTTRRRSTRQRRGCAP